MSVKAPPDRRKFANDWDEIGYLYDKLLYWLYQREAPAKARPYAGRLERLVRRADPNEEAIRGAGCRSLVFEAKGDLEKAIEHRRLEIKRIYRLHATVQERPDTAWVLQGYEWDELSDRLDLLAILQHDAGQLDEAIKTLEESRKLCREHRVKFDGLDLLEDYLEEKKSLLETSQVAKSRLVMTGVARRSRGA